MKYAFVDAHREQVSIQRMCRLLQVSPKVGISATSTAVTSVIFPFGVEDTPGVCDCCFKPSRGTSTWFNMKQPLTSRDSRITM